MFEGIPLLLSLDENWAPPHSPALPPAQPTPTNTPVSAPTSTPAPSTTSPPQPSTAPPALPSTLPRILPTSPAPITTPTLPTQPFSPQGPGPAGLTPMRKSEDSAFIGSHSRFFFLSYLTQVSVQMNCVDVLALTERTKANWTALRLLPSRLKLEYDDISTIENGPKSPGVRVRLDPSESARPSLSDANAVPMVLEKAHLQSALALSPSFSSHSARLKQVRDCNVWCCFVLCGTASHCAALDCATLYCTALYCMLLQYAVLYCTVMHRTILYKPNLITQRLSSLSSLLSSPLLFPSLLSTCTHTYRPSKHAYRTICTYA